MKKVLAGLLGVFALVGGGYYLYFVFSEQQGTTQENTAPYVVPAMGEEYRNEIFGFSLTMPQGFSAREVAGEGSTVVVLEDGASNGIQIMITPFDEDLSDLTAERIREDIPDLAMNNQQVVEVGTNKKGLAFKSDNQAFNGASREVWFVFRGNLYQISTYERLDPLLKSIFATWQFF